MVETVRDLFVKWTWLGPLLFVTLLSMVTSYVVSSRNEMKQDIATVRMEFNERIAASEKRIVRLEELAIQNSTQNAEQNGKLDMILFRMDKLSNRVDTILQMHIPKPTGRGY